MEVQAALFENNVFLMGQHMLQYAITGQHPAPMPARDQPVGGLRRLHRQGRRADLPRRGQRRAVADLLRHARLRRPEGRSGAEDEQRARARAADAARRPCASAWRLAAPPNCRAASRRAGLPFAPIMRPEDLLRRPAPARHRRPRRRRAARRRARRADGEDDAVPDHARRPAPPACGCSRRASASTRDELLAALGYARRRDRRPQRPGHAVA